MAYEMGNKNLDTKTNESEKSYKLINCPAPLLAPDFKNLIMAPFLNTLRYGNDLFKLIDKDCYYDAYGKFIEHLLQRPFSILRYAQLDDGTVLGWCLFEDKKIHYVWVKKEARRKGIGRSLLPKEFDTITHITNKGVNIWVNHFPEIRFNPFA